MTTDFGKDISCTDGLRTGRFATGVRLVAEAAYRRLITPRGSLRGGEDEANYGEDLSQLIGEVLAGTTVQASIPGRVQNELKKDERIETVTTTVTEVASGPGKAFLIDIECETAEGPFTLRLNVNEVTVELLGITEG